MEPLGKTTPEVSPQRWCARTLRHGRADARAQANEHHGDDHDHRDARHPHRAHDEKVAGRAWSGACRPLRRDGPLRCVRDRGRADLQPAQGIGRCKLSEEEGVVDDVVSGVRVGRRCTTHNDQNQQSEGELLLSFCLRTILYNMNKNDAPKHVVNEAIDAINRSNREAPAIIVISKRVQEVQ